MNSPLKSHWQELAASLIPEDADPEIVEQIRGIFYAGACAALKIQFESREIDTLIGEIKAFAPRS